MHANIQNLVHRDRFLKIFLFKSRLEIYFSQFCLTYLPESCPLQIFFWGGQLPLLPPASPRTPVFILVSWDDKAGFRGPPPVMDVNFPRAFSDRLPRPSVTMSVIILKGTLNPALKLNDVEPAIYKYLRAYMIIHSYRLGLG